MRLREDFFLDGFVGGVRDDGILLGAEGVFLSHLRLDVLSEPRPFKLLAERAAHQPGVRVGGVVRLAVVKDEAHVLGELLRAGVRAVLLRLLVEFLLDFAEIHRILDDVEVVRDVVLDGIDSLVEYPRVLVLAHGPERLAALLHERLVAQDPDGVNLLRLEHAVRDHVPLLVAFGNLLRLLAAAARRGALRLPRDVVNQPVHGFGRALAFLAVRGHGRGAGGLERGLIELRVGVNHGGELRLELSLFPSLDLLLLSLDLILGEAGEVHLVDGDFGDGLEDGDLRRARGGGFVTDLFRFGRRHV